MPKPGFVVQKVVLGRDQGNSEAFSRRRSGHGAPVRGKKNAPIDWG